MQELRSDDAVEHRVKPSHCEPAGRWSNDIGDDVVVIVGLGQPRIDRAVTQEPEERVALDEHARAHRQSKALGNRRLPRAGSTGDNEPTGPVCPSATKCASTHTLADATAKGPTGRKASEHLARPVGSTGGWAVSGCRYVVVRDV